MADELYRYQAGELLTADKLNTTITQLDTRASNQIKAGEKKRITLGEDWNRSQVFYRRRANTVLLSGYLQYKKDIGQGIYNKILTLPPELRPLDDFFIVLPASRLATGSLAGQANFYCTPNGDVDIYVTEGIRFIYLHGVQIPVPNQQ